MAITPSCLRTLGLWTTGANALLTLSLIVVAFVSTLFVGPAATAMLPALLLMLVLIIWTQSANLLLIWLLRRNRSPLRTQITSIGSLIVGVWSVIALSDAFLLRPDPQSALVVLFLPFLQWSGCAIIVLADALCTRIHSEDVTPSKRPVLSRRLLQGLLCVAALLSGSWLVQRPSNTREWASNLSRLPQATFDGDMVTIRSIRNTQYRSAEDYTPAYDDRSFDLNHMQSIDFIMVPFQNTSAAAHTFLVFGFEDGQRVAISVEVRREKGESYSPLLGLFRQCELMYVIADERDLILLRTKYRNDRVFLYPIRAAPERIRDMFVSMLRRANQLGEQPEFYNSLTNNCTSNLLKHFNHVNEHPLPANLKILFPGYSDQLIYDLGLIDSPLDFHSLKRQSEITEKANRFADDLHFSQQIRK